MKNWNTDPKKFSDESVRVIGYKKGRLVFQLKSNCALFAKISHSYFLPIEPSGNPTVEIKIMRQSKLFDTGEYTFHDRDQESFKLPNIIPSFWKKKHRIDRSISFELCPEMFEEGDEIIFHHNCREKLEDQLLDLFPKL